MKDSLEEFIKNNKSSFDDRKAPPGVWDRISKKEPAKVHHLWKWSAVAASGLLLIAVGYLFGIKAHAQPDIPGWTDYLEAENYYQTRIDDKMEEMKVLAVSQEVMTDLQMLDEVYATLRQQLMEDPNANSERLLSAMIKHQQQKLNVIENILKRVNKYKTDENKQLQI